MTNEPLERDPELANALAGIADDDVRGYTDWAELRRGIHARASSELARRRWSRRRFHVLMPTSLAAGIALFLLVAHEPSRPVTGDPGQGQVAVAGAASIEELLDANVSDGQFRALVSGASDANDLLSIAAGEGQP